MRAIEIANLLADGAKASASSLVVQRSYRLPVLTVASAEALAEVSGMSKTLAYASLVEAGFEAVLAKCETRDRKNLQAAQGRIVSELAAAAEGVEEC